MFFQPFHLSDVIYPFTTGNPFLGTKLLGFSIGRGSGAPKGLKVRRVIPMGYVGLHG